MNSGIMGIVRKVISVIGAPFVVLVLVTGLLLGVGAMPGFAASDGYISLKINETKVKDPFVHMMGHDRVYVSVETFANYCGVTYTWDQSTGTLTLDGKTVHENLGKVHVLYGVPTASVRAMSETLNKDIVVDWNAAESIVNVTLKDQPVFAKGNINIRLTAGITLIAILLFGLMVRIGRRKQRMEERIKKYIGQELPGESLEEVESGKEKSTGILRRVIAVLGKQFLGMQFVRRWERDLEQANLSLQPEEFFALRLMTAAGACFLASLLGYQGVILGLALLIGYLVPGLYLKRRKEKRLERCGAQLASALGTMANALRAGFSLMQAMHLVGQEVPDPLGPEFDRTLREINLGVPLEEALHRLLERLPDDDLDMVISALLIQRSTGGNLAELLETTQETIHGRMRIKEELKALTAQGRLSAWIISLLPVVLFFILNLMNPEYFEPMLSRPIGWALLGGAALTGFIGWMVIRKIVRIEV